MFHIFQMLFTNEIDCTHWAVIIIQWNMMSLLKGTIRISYASRPSICWCKVTSLGFPSPLFTEVLSISQTVYVETQSTQSAIKDNGSCSDWAGPPSLCSHPNFSNTQAPAFASPIPYSKIGWAAQQFQGTLWPNKELTMKQALQLSYCCSDTQQECQ